MPPSLKWEIAWEAQPGLFRAATSTLHPHRTPSQSLSSSRLRSPKHQPNLPPLLQIPCRATAAPTQVLARSGREEEVARLAWRSPQRFFQPSPAEATAQGAAQHSDWLGGMGERERGGGGRGESSAERRAPFSRVQRAGPAFAPAASSTLGPWQAGPLVVGRRRGLSS